MGSAGNSTKESFTTHIAFNVLWVVVNLRPVDVLVGIKVKTHFAKSVIFKLSSLPWTNVFSIAKLDSIRIKANVNLQITIQEAVPHFNVGRLYELIVDSKDPNHSRLIVDLFLNHIGRELNTLETFHATSFSG